MNEELRSNLLSKKHWSRLVFMLLVSVVLYMAFFITWFVIVAQFTFALVTGNDNDNLRRLGASLALFIRQCVSFLTYSDDIKPFPFSDWPQAEETDIRETYVADENMGTDVQTPQDSEAMQGDSSESNTQTQAQDAIVDDAEVNEVPPTISTDKDDVDKDDVDKKDA